jgi:hypothetical protein
MDLKDKQRSVIKFLLLQGCAGEEIVNASGMCTTQLRTVALQYSYGSAKFAAAAKNSETKGALENPVDTKLTRRFGQFYKKT